MMILMFWWSRKETKRLILCKYSSGAIWLKYGQRKSRGHSELFNVFPTWEWSWELVDCRASNRQEKNHKSQIKTSLLLSSEGKNRSQEEPERTLLIDEKSLKATSPASKNIARSSAGAAHETLTVLFPLSTGDNVVGYTTLNVRHFHIQNH
jgi:hypothetical protein